MIFSYGVRAADIRASALDAIRIARLVTALMALVAVVAMVLARPLLRSDPRRGLSPPSPAPSAW